MTPNRDKYLFSKDKFFLFLRAHNEKNPDDKLSQKSLARELGVDHTTFNKWVAGKHEIKGWALSAVADRLGCRAEDLLLGGEDIIEETTEPQGDYKLNRLLELVREFIKPMNASLEDIRETVREVGKRTDSYGIAGATRYESVVEMVKSQDEKITFLQDSIDKRIAQIVSRQTINMGLFLLMARTLLEPMRAMAQTEEQEESVHHLEEVIDEFVRQTAEMEKEH